MRKLATIILFALFGFAQAGLADVNLSVNPVDGSNSLRFEKVSFGTEGDHEIHIRVSSTNGDRFQVFQRILEPLVNEKGEALNLQAIGTQTMPNSNSEGTLYLQNSDHLNMSDQLLYSSSQSGASDAFMIRYFLDRSLINAAGIFRGRLVFTVRGMGNAANSQVTIDVQLETPSNFKVAVKGAHNPTRVRIQGSSTSERTADFVDLSFSGNSGREIRIYQELDTLPQNEGDQELGGDVVQWDPQGNTEGLHSSGPSTLKPGRTLVYSSNKDEDDVRIYFLLNADQAQMQDAGSYLGKIKYVVETDQGRQEFPIDVQCDISPVFTLNVTTPPEGLSFAHVLANSPPQDKEVLVTVLSNLHKPYQVTQNLQTNMTNQQGKEFDSKYFTVQVEIPPGQKGRSDFVEFSPVATGEYPVFSSDASGSGATFKLLYRLQGYSQMSAGNFLVPIRLSLNQK